MDPICSSPSTRPNAAKSSPAAWAPARWALGTPGQRDLPCAPSPCFLFPTAEPRRGHQPQAHAGKGGTPGSGGVLCCCEGLRGRLQVAPLLWDLSFPFSLWLRCGSTSPGLTSKNGNSSALVKAVNT